MDIEQTLFKKVDYKLEALLLSIEMGTIGLPDIQRPFVWKISQVRDLFDSMYRGFPVGHLLFWESGAGKDVRQIGADEKQKNPSLLIVDGQQRLTSLYAVLRGIPVLTNDYEEKKISIGFKPAIRPEDAKFAVTSASIKKDPDWIPDISKLWTRNEDRFKNDFIRRLREKRNISEDEEDCLRESIGRLHDLNQSMFTAFELFSTVNEEQVADIFVRINSQGKKINTSDFILTLMSVFWGDGRKILESFCRDAKKSSKGSPFNQFIEPEPSQMLRASVALGFGRARMKYAYLLLRGKDLETEQFSDTQRDRQFKILRDSQEYVLDVQNWHEFHNALVLAGFCGKKMITSESNLVYCYAIFLIGKRDFNVKHDELRGIIARWFVMSSMTGRYTGTVESTMEADLNNLKRIKVKNANEFINVLDEIIRGQLTDDFWNKTLPQNLHSSSATSPSLFAYYAMLNVLDAPVLFSKMKIHTLFNPLARAKKSDLEEHHLFPKDYLKSVEIVEDDNINQIANRALVEWPDNLDISNMPPHEYLPKFTDKLTDEMRKMHALPDSWENMEYEEFLKARRILMAKVIRKGFETLDKIL